MTFALFSETFTVVVIWVAILYAIEYLDRH